MKTILEMKGVTKSFGEKIIFDKLDLRIEQGEMVAIMGESGSGKTTLLNMLGLIEPFSGGAFTIFGYKNPKVNGKMSEKIIREHVSYLYQNFALIEDENVFENLYLALRYLKKNKAEKTVMIKNALKQVGLHGFEKHKVFACSGGEQQRVALARAMLKPGQLILADEPTGSLDKENREIVMGLLHGLHQSGKTIIVVTHDLEVAAACEKQYFITKDHAIQNETHRMKETER